MSEPIFRVEGLGKVFETHNFFGREQGERRTVALDGVDLEIQAGEVLGVAGESGSGKTTLGEILVGLQHPTSGRVLFDGQDLARMDRAQWRTFRRSVQMVFQDPYESLNPRFTVYRAVAEPLLVAGIKKRGELEARVADALEHVGLRPARDFFDRYPHQLSGGQRQRVVIACAIVLEPRVIVADEPISMLDVSLRAGILTLLRRLKEELNLTVVYVSHDLSTMGYLSDRMAVLYRGKLVEIGPTVDLLEQPGHPYTRALLAAAPSLDAVDVDETPPPPAPAAAGSAGCRFYPLCPLRMPVCLERDPPLIEIGAQHSSACLLHEAAPREKEVQLA